MQSRRGDKPHDQIDVKVRIQPPGAVDRALRRWRFPVPGQVERYQLVMFDDARIGHQAMELPPIGAGGVHAQQILARSRPFAVDLIGDAADGHGHIAAGERWHRSGSSTWVQRHRHRPAQGQPLPDFEHAPRDMGVLHDGEFVALNREFRQPVHHREDAVMVTRRNRFEKPGPRRCGRRQDKGGSPRFGRAPPFDEIENRHIISRRDREANGPRPRPGAKHRIGSTRVSPGGGVGEDGHCGRHRSLAPGLATTHAQLIGCRAIRSRSR